MPLRLPSPIDITGKTVLLRVDFNVPLDERGKIIDDRRIRAASETIDFLRQNQAKIVLLAHFGRPEPGQDNGKYSLKPIADYCATTLGWPIAFASDCIGEIAQQAVKALQPGQVVLLENLRFHQEEEANDASFAAELAKLGQIYINDAFSVSHRAHTSTAALAKKLPAFAGFALAKEVEALTLVRDNPIRPLVVVIGGAKISDKVEAVVNLAHKADIVLIGGGVANNFLKAEGLEIHKSYLQDAPADLKKKGIDYVHVAADLLKDERTNHIWLNDYIPLPKILYPLDVVAAQSPDASADQTETLDLTHDMLDTPNDRDLMYLDIGPKTIKLFSELIASAGTVFWNGPLGMYEKPPFATGTREIAGAVAARSGTPTSNGQTAQTIIGGGDTVAAIESFGLGEKMSYLSMAGGASLEFLAGKELPGLADLTISSQMTYT